MQNKKFFQVIKDTLNDFFHYAILKPNLQKTCCFLSGVSAAEKETLENLLSIPEETLPVKYLGVPSISTNLKADLCKQMIEKILSRIQGWSDTLLSYGRRL